MSRGDDCAIMEISGLVELEIVYCFYFLSFSSIFVFFLNHSCVVMGIVTIIILFRCLAIFLCFAICLFYLPILYVYIRAGNLFM